MPPLRFPYCGWFICFFLLINFYPCFLPFIPPLINISFWSIFIKKVYGAMDLFRGVSTPLKYPTAIEEFSGEKPLSMDLDFGDL